MQYTSLQHTVLHSVMSCTARCASISAVPLLALYAVKPFVWAFLVRAGDDYVPSLTRAKIIQYSDRQFLDVGLS